MWHVHTQTHLWLLSDRRMSWGVLKVQDLSSKQIMLCECKYCFIHGMCMDCCLNCWLITCWRHHSSFKLTIHFWMLWMARTLKQHGNTGHQTNTEAVKQKENHHNVMLREKENRASHKSIYFVKKNARKSSAQSMVVFHKHSIYNCIQIWGFFYVLINSNSNTSLILTTRMRVPRHSARPWRISSLRIWKKRESFSKYNFCLPMLLVWVRLMRL